MDGDRIEHAVFEQEAKDFGRQKVPPQRRRIFAGRRGAAARGCERRGREWQDAHAAHCTRLPAPALPPKRRSKLYTVV
eukprot:2785183-Pyramimonas_sp.AAC.1